MRTESRLWIAPALAVLGLADSGYLAVTHWMGELPQCGGYEGCAQVNSSPYAELYGVPVAAFGAAMYGVILLISVQRARSMNVPRSSTATLLLYVLTLAGSLFMAYLTGIELFVLGAVCFWCLGAAMITFLLFGLSALDLRGQPSSSSAPLRGRRA